MSHREQFRRVVRPAFDGTVSLRTQSVRPFVQVFFISELKGWVEVVPAAFISPGLCESTGSSGRGMRRSDKAETCARQIDSIIQIEECHSCQSVIMKVSRVWVSRTFS